jgi:hypothetical protein
MMGPVIPAYFHPRLCPEAWQRLTDEGPAVRAVVLNAADGPGHRPDLALRTAAARLRVPVLGYVDTAYGHRTASDVVGDVARHVAWYPVTGIFFDQVAAGRDVLAFYERLAAAARRHGCATVMFHHGVYPDPAYAEVADILGVFEGPARHYPVRVPRWTGRFPPAKFSHLVYDAPQHLLSRVLTRAAGCRVGSLYPTDRSGANPWDGLPSYFSELRRPPCRPDG